MPGSNHGNWMPRCWDVVFPAWPAPIQWSMTLLNDLSVNGVMYPCCLYFAVPGLPPTTKQLWLTLHCSSELTELSWQPQTLRETRGWIYVNIDLIGESYFPTLFKYANSYFKIDNTLETRDFFLINKQFLPAGSFYIPTIQTTYPWHYEDCVDHHDGSEVEAEAQDIRNCLHLFCKESQVVKV